MPRYGSGSFTRPQAPSQLFFVRSVLARVVGVSPVARRIRLFVATPDHPPAGTGSPAMNLCARPVTFSGGQ
eukprot:11191782-Lingulodinium_polyedra.AAC.1